MTTNSALQPQQPSLFAKTMQTFVSLFGVLGISVFSAIIMSRGLSTDERGVYLGVTMWNGFVLGLCDVGIYMATIYLMGKSKEEDRRDIFTTLFLWAVGTSAVALIAVIIVAHFMMVHLEGFEKMAAYIFYASTLGGPLTSMLTGVEASKERYTLMNLVRVGLPFLLTGFWLVYFVMGILSISVCLITSAAVSFLSVLPFFWSNRFYFKNPGRFRFSIWKKGFWYGLRSYGGVVIAVFGNNGTQVMLFSLTPSALALFQTAQSATGVLWSIPRAVGTTSLPNMIHEDLHSLHVKVSRFIRLTSVSIIIGGIMLGLAEPVFIPLLFGLDYAPAIIPALLLMPNALFGGWADVLANALNSTGRTLHNTIASGVYVVSTLGSMLLTVGAWGMNGAAVSMVFGYMMNFLVRFIWYSYSIKRFSFRHFIPGTQDVSELVRLVWGMVRKVLGKGKARISASMR